MRAVPPSPTLFTLPRRQDPDIVAATENHFSRLTEDQIGADLADLAARSGGTIAIIALYRRTGHPLPGANGNCSTPRRPDLHRTYSPGGPDRQLFLFCRPRDDELDNADRDRSRRNRWMPIPQASSLPPLLHPLSCRHREGRTATDLTGIFAFPAGTRAGIFIHDIFEALDFTDDSAIEGVVGKKLGEHGYDPYWQETLCTMIRKVLAAPLDPSVPGLRFPPSPPPAASGSWDSIFPSNRSRRKSWAGSLPGKASRNIIPVRWNG